MPPRQARPEWQRAALLRGAEVALLGAAMPGNASRSRWPRRRGGRGGWTRRRRGQRGGPGGAPAFPRARGCGRGAENVPAGGTAGAAVAARRRWPACGSTVSRRSSTLVARGGELGNARNGAAGAHRVARQARCGGAGDAADGRRSSSDSTPAGRSIRASVRPVISRTAAVRRGSRRACWAPADAGARGRAHSNPDQRQGRDGPD